MPNSKPQEIENQKQKRQKYIKEKRCTDCGGTPSNNRRKCQYCIDREKERGMLYRLKIRKDILEAYGNKCICCGERRQEFLAIDHVKNNGSQHRRKNKTFHLYTHIKNNNYPKDAYQLLCNNCNWTKYAYQICPHQIGQKSMVISILDTDLYKFTVQQVIFHQFPLAKANFKFINRGESKFPKDFSSLLKEQVKFLSELKLKDDEVEWLKNTGYFQEDYLNFLKQFQFNLSEINIDQDNNELSINIEGSWLTSTLWEIPLMSLISELYFQHNQAKNSALKTSLISAKQSVEHAFINDVRFSDFGTRRRYSFNHHNNLIECCGKGLLGTSNCFFAKKFQLNSIGTTSHEGIMGMQGHENCKEIKDCNNLWIDAWKKEYEEKLNIFLPDTITTKQFWETVRIEDLRKFKGIRQDSGNPGEFIKTVIDKYNQANINPKDKIIICSDGLDVYRLVKIRKEFGNNINIIGGIGTSFTNRITGIVPLNMVIKLNKINMGHGWINVVKLSDSPGKETGDLNAIKRIKEQIQELYT